MAQKTEKTTDSGRETKLGVSLRSAGTAGLKVVIDGIGTVTLPPELVPEAYDPAVYDFEGTCVITSKFFKK
jgi:hypothetical protein